MKRWYKEGLEKVFETLWDWGWEYYPEIARPVPNVEIRDTNNEDKQVAYRRGCCDGIELLLTMLRQGKLLNAQNPEIYRAEDFVKTIKQNNGL